MNFCDTNVLHDNLDKVVDQLLSHPMTETQQKMNMKKFIMALVLGLSVLTACFAEGPLNKIKVYSHETSDEFLYLGLSIYKDNPSVSLLVFSYAQKGCSQIIIFIDMETNRALKFYDEQYEKSNSELKDYICKDFAFNSDLYHYNSDTNTYSISYDRTEEQEE